MKQLQKILVAIGAIVTITVSIGGSYVTTQVTFARHDERINNVENKITEIEITQKEDRDILLRIDKTVAVIEERTKDK